MRRMSLPGRDRPAHPPDDDFATCRTDCPVPLRARPLGRAELENLPKGVNGGSLSIVREYSAGSLSLAAGVWFSATDCDARSRARAWPLVSHSCRDLGAGPAFGPLFAVGRADIESFARDLEERGRARATVTPPAAPSPGSAGTRSSKTCWSISSAAHVRRPRRVYESHAVKLDRNELGSLLVAAGRGCGSARLGRSRAWSGRMAGPWPSRRGRSAPMGCSGCCGGAV
jgi:hypothetical protein